MANTVGELRRLLEDYPDGMHVTFLDDEGKYCDPIEFVGVKSLGRFSRQGAEYYRDYKLYTDDEWVRDEEVIILG